MSLLAGPTGSSVKPQYTGLQVQTSSSSVAVPLMWGANRLAPNIIWYGDFTSVKQEEKAGKGGGKITSYTYTASIIMGLCQGPIDSINQVFKNTQEKISGASLASEGYTVFLGTPGQSPWGYLTSNHPTEALGYSELAYVAAPNYELGQSASTPQHSFEVFGPLYNTGINANGDADPALIVQDFLVTGPDNADFDADRLDLDSLLSSADATTTGDSAFQTYCRAHGLSMSPVLADQQEASKILEDWAQLMNCALVWTGYTLRLIPLSTAEITANGYHFVPVSDAAYTISFNDLLVSGGEFPLMGRRQDPAEASNALKLNIRDRSNEYNDLPVEWKDQGLIDLYGERQGDTIEGRAITDKDVGAKVISLIGQTGAYLRNEYEFTLPSNFIRLEPMDIVIVQEEGQDDVALWVWEIQEQDEGEIQIVGRELPPGFAQAAQAQSIQSIPLNRFDDPGDTNTPIIFQPPLSLTEGVSELWVALSGGDDSLNSTLWGGAYVYLSLDDTSFTLIGEIDAPARQGKVSATSPITVDLAMSAGILESITSTDVEDSANLSLLGDELVAFRTATLVGSNEYELTDLSRGLHGTTETVPSVDDRFVRLDEKTFRYQIPMEYNNKTIYLKFQSFNVWRSGLQDLSSLSSHTVALGDAQLSAPTGVNTFRGDLTWQGANLELVCDPLPGVTGYDFEIIRPDDSGTVRLIVSSIPSCAFSSALANAVGIERSYKIRARGRRGTVEGPWSSTQTITNTAPDALSTVAGSTDAVYGIITFDLDLTDPDVEGYIVFYSPNTGFDPTSAGFNQVGGSSPIYLYGLSAGTYYAKVAAYDPWTRNPAELNLSSQISFTISTGGGSSTPGGDGGGGYGGGGGGGGRDLDGGDINED